MAEDPSLRYTKRVCVCDIIVGFIYGVLQRFYQSYTAFVDSLTSGRKARSHPLHFLEIFIMKLSPPR